MTINSNQKEYLKRFGQVVRELRDEKGLSQEQLGFLVNLDRSYVGGIERGERNLSFLKIIQPANFFEISLEELFKGF